MDYNCWLVFRALVDLVLLNDFFSYVVFAFAFSEAPARWTWLEVAGYIGGFGLCVFNWFIKLDALRVVKDYAWCTCHNGSPPATAIRPPVLTAAGATRVRAPPDAPDWGDFFFLVDGTLTFDGVFQMAPHPMYSIGYVDWRAPCPSRSPRWGARSQRRQSASCVRVTRAPSGTLAFTASASCPGRTRCCTSAWQPISASSSS